MALPDHADVLGGRVAFAWRTMDAFYEEDERIIGHASDFHNRIDIRATSGHLVVRAYFEQQFSIDACHVYKPASQVYHHVARQLDVVPSVCMMVAARVWDTVGAQSAGFSSALITRPGNAPLAVGGRPQPTLIASDLHEVAQQLCAMRPYEP